MNVGDRVRISEEPYYAGYSEDFRGYVRPDFAGKIGEISELVDDNNADVYVPKMGTQFIALTCLESVPDTGDKILRCSCGALLGISPGIGPYCTRTGRDADCATPDPVFETPHKTILEAAQEIVHGPRRQAYGHPKANHDRIAAMWNGFLAGRPDRNADLTATEVVLMMLLLKVARLQETPQHADSWQDLAGYAACGAIIEGVDPA